LRKLQALKTVLMDIAGQFKRLAQVSKSVQLCAQDSQSIQITRAFL
jgi:hypothetical protein